MNHDHGHTPNHTAQASGSRPPARPPGPAPVLLDAKTQAEEASANKLFEQNAVKFAQPTDTEPATIHPSEIDELRRKYPIASARLAKLTQLHAARLDYYLEQKSGTQPFDPLTPEQIAEARAFFEKHGARLKGERAQAPANPIRERDQQAQAANTPAPKTPVAAAAGPAPETTAAPESAASAERPGVRPPLAIPPPASMRISFLSAEDFLCELVLSAPSGVMVLEQGAAARKKLVEQGAKPVPQAAPTVVNVAGPAANAAGSDHADGDAAPMCAIHKTPMQKRKGRDGSFWSCPQKLDDGSWCPYKPPK